jgi:TRAP-type C4-dicarboxylate transport system substrate-binding protein
MRRQLTITTLLACSVALLVPGGTITTNSMGMPVGAESPQAEAPPATRWIPAGTYSRIVTQAGGEAAGLDPGFLVEFLGEDGELLIELEFEGGNDRMGTWRMYVTSDAGVREVGTAGTYGYDLAGHLVTIEECCGWALPLEWTLTDGVLTLTLAPLEGVEWPAEARFITEGEYHAQSAVEGASGVESPVVLRFANPLDDAPPQLVAFAEEVQRLSDGSIEFEWLPGYGVEPATGGAYSDAEATILAAVADGTIDIGRVGARALPGFEALLAPLLVDGHDLQERVFDAGIPARMLADLDGSGLVGIAVLPGPLRRVMGVNHPFPALADFSGATIANDRAALAVATMTALGAESVPGASGLPLDGVDAVLAQFQAIVGNGYHTQADSVVANVNFWPRPLAIVMSAESFEALSPEQQAAPQTAGANAVEPAMEASRDEDAVNGAQLCEAPIDVIEASESELAEMEAALEPVYEDLATDPRMAAYLDEIRALKEELDARPDTLTCPERDVSR